MVCDNCDVDAVMARTETRQGCEKGPTAKEAHCMPDEWEHADLFTLDAVDSPVEVADDASTLP